MSMAGLYGQQRPRLFRKRFAALGARLPETRIPTATPRRQVGSRIPFALAGKFRRLRFRFDNWQFDGYGSKYDMPTSLTIQKAAVEINGTTVPVYFSGSRSVTLASGEIGRWSDWVRPRAFGFSRFQTDLNYTTNHGYRVYEGLLCFFRATALTPNFTGEIPIGCIAEDTDGEGFFALYDPANDIDQVDSTGPMATPTDALTTTDFVAVGHESGVPNNMGFGPSEIIGETFDGRQLVMFLRGPSTTSGREDDRSPTDMTVGWGFVDRAMQSEDNSLGYVIPMGHATRTGGDIASMGANPGINQSFKFANHLFDWMGGNGLDVYTPKQEVDENLPVVLNKAKAGGIRYTFGVLNSPRTDSTDGWTTYAGQSHSSGRFAPGGGADYLMRRTGRAGADGTLDLVMALPGIRSKYDPFKWADNMAADGLHEPKAGHQLLASDVRWVLNEGLAMPRVSRNFAAACLIKPSADTLNKIEVFMAAAAAAGVTNQTALWLKAPILEASDAGYQIRRVNMVWPGVWYLYQNDSGGTITYGPNGTKSDGTAFLGMFLTPTLDFSPGNAAELSPVLEDSITIAFKCNDETDTKPVIGTPSSSFANRTLYVNPRDGSGNFTCRLNDNAVNFSKPCSSAIGTFVATRNGATREAYRNKVSLGSDTAATAGFSAERLRLFASIAVGDITQKELSFMCISHGWNSTQAAAMTDAIDALTA